MTTARFSISKTAALAAIVLGVAAGSYGVAAAANGSSSGSSTTTAAPGGGAAPWGQKRSDETLLTGDALTKVTAVANAKVPGGTIVRVETDADGNARYEAHMTKADGTPVTVYVDANFQLVSVQ